MTERNFPVGAFDDIELAGAYEATVRTRSARRSVPRAGRGDILDNLIVEVDGNVLKVHPKGASGIHWGWGDAKSKIELTITVPSLRGAELAGSGGIRIDKVSGDGFDGAVAALGGLTVDQVDVGSLKLGIAGSGDAKAVGKARTVAYDIAGSGGIDGKGVVAEDADVSIAGSGGVSVHATKTASVSIAGSGDVDVTGGAKCNTSKMGSGNVHCS